MGIEIERKFLVEDESWKSEAGEGLVCKQGYMVSESEKTVRVRIMGENGYLTIKGATKGITRSEFEYPIPVEDAEAMLGLCGGLVEKTRFLILHAGMTWELDIFAGDNEGLVMAEIELESEDQLFEIPEWAGKEVSDDIRYFNGYLSKVPFTQW
ncbi:CYTH domain-containing protein [Pontiella sulfatireligans]|uniref:Inorganic triphosphatase n=1 Tax=Pontiella sulfatireligans TaxID=2750658 RepID=A0A6C2UJ12_9BACT|nr:CYTH domain-containing protein [Pontiella sulfatireligans]VGO19437.1 Inorganic triphosphatase [Pontiella sulfatireligans]